MAAQSAEVITDLLSTDGPNTGPFTISGLVNTTDFPLLKGFQYVNVTVRLMMGLLAINCNLLTVVAIGRYEYLRSCTNYLIAALAFADMLGGCNCILVFFNYLIPMSDETWLKMCATEVTFSQTSAGLNLSYLLLISVDRFIFITFPLRYHSLVTPKWLIGAIVIPCILIATHFIALHLDPGGYNTEFPGRICAKLFPPRLTFTINLWFYVLSPVIVVLNIRIAWIAYKQGRAIEQAQVPNANNKKEYKITKMLSLVLGVYFACYLPAMITTMATSRGYPNIYVSMLSRVFSWVWWVNSWVNPFIYAWKNNNFNKAFRSLLRLKTPTVDPMQGN